MPSFKEYLTSIGASENNMPKRLVVYYGNENAILTVPPADEVTSLTKMGLNVRRFALYTNKNLKKENMLTDCYVSSAGIGHIADVTSPLGDFDTKMTFHFNGKMMSYQASAPFNRLNTKYIPGSKIYSRVSSGSIYVPPNGKQNAKNMLRYNSVVQQNVTNILRKTAFYNR